MRDEVLPAPVPAFAVGDMSVLLAHLNGLDGAEATAPASERDQILRLPTVVVKISNAAERRQTLELESGAQDHLAAVDPGRRRRDSCARASRSRPSSTRPAAGLGHPRAAPGDAGYR